MHMMARPLAAVLLGVVSCCLANAAEIKRLSTFKLANDLWKTDGTQPVRVNGLDLVYVRKAARLDGYSKVWLKPAVVEVNPDWQRKSGMAVSSTPVKVKPVIEAVTVMVREEVEKALVAGGYQLVDAPGEGVVEVDAAVVNLFLIATEGMVMRGDNVEAKSVGRMTLVADLRESSTGELILHAFDDELGPKPEQRAHGAAAECMEWVRSALAGWAATLKNGLDISTGKKPLAAR